MKIQDIRTIIGAHETYWDSRSAEMRAFSNVYKAQMFGDKTGRMTAEFVTIETSDAYGVVESTVSSLFPKAPSVVVGADVSDKGSPEVAQSAINQFLFDKAIQVETALRYALIFPCSFFKVGLQERDSALDSINMKAVKPWDILLDMDAEQWDDQRFVGHRYYLPFSQAKQQFGSKQGWNAGIKTDFLEAGKKRRSTESSAPEEVSEALQYIEVWEIYDLLEDEMCFYSPNLSTSEGIIEKHKILFRKGDGSPLAPIVPMYLAHDVHTPLRGMSTVGRQYDAFFEINNLRTVWANGVRRDVRMYLARKGILDEESKAILAENRDMSVVELDIPPDQSPNTALSPMGKIPYSSDHSIYKAEIRSDLDRGSLMAPFTRGQATMATATEISAMAEYTASEIGKQAKGRDEAIRMVAEVYLSLLTHLLETQPKGAKKEVVLLNKKPIVLTPEHFSAKFKIVAADGSSTPISGLIQKQQLTELAPMLMQLGVPQQAILEEIVNAYNLPEKFILDAQEAIQKQEEAAAQQAQQAQQAPQMPNPEEGAGGIPVGGGAIASAIRGGQLPQGR